MDINQSWNAALKLIEQEISSSIGFETWILPIVPVGIDGSRFLLQVSDNVCKEILEKRHLTLIRSALKNVTGINYDIVILTEGEKTPVHTTAEMKKEESGDVARNLNPKYVFSSFVVGNSNRMAHAASLAVAESPAKAYNPLFLYGNSGLGKTHLMHSIAHFILDKNPAAKVLYVTSETFTNELILSIQNNKNEEFRNKYRNIDVLLIDDIQFISKKEGTQEEFFHTFNALHSAGKQIILTSDKPPKDMETLEDRIRSRFEWGLIADIGTPDYETRMAILRRKVEADDMKLSDEILNYIATNIKSNIRELEGALNKLLAYSNLEKTDITMEIAMKELQNIITPDKPREITPQLVIEVVTEHFNISLDQMISKNRSNEIARPRQIAMYLCKNMTDIPLDSIGQLLGGRDHSTIIHGIKKIADEYESNENTRNLIETIKKKINPN